VRTLAPIKFISMERPNSACAETRARQGFADEGFTAGPVVQLLAASLIHDPLRTVPAVVPESCPW